MLFYCGKKLLFSNYNYLPTHLNRILEICTVIKNDKAPKSEIAPIAHGRLSKEFTNHQKRKKMEKVNKVATSNATEIMKAVNGTASAETLLVGFMEESISEGDFEDSESTELGSFSFEL